MTGPVVPFPPPASVPAGDPEAGWVARARAGDTGAFERLYRAHSGRVHAVCLRLLADPGRAEDATQDAFVRAWQRLGSFRGESAFGSWLYRLAANVALDRLRYEQRRRAATGEGLDPDGAPAESSAGTAPAAKATAPGAPEGAGIDLERAIRALPPRARTVFVLHDLEGYRHGEIAALAGIAVGTSKAQLHRARNLLRETLR